MPAWTTARRACTACTCRPYRASAVSSAVCVVAAIASWCRASKAASISMGKSATLRALSSMRNRHANSTWISFAAAALMPRASVSMIPRHGSGGSAPSGA